jgi:hypothetical protein
MITSVEGFKWNLTYFKKKMLTNLVNPNFSPLFFYAILFEMAKDKDYNKQNPDGVSSSKKSVSAILYYSNYQLMRTKDKGKYHVYS